MIGRPRSVRVRIGFTLAVVILGASWVGCGDGDFVPPPPGSRAPADSGEASPAVAGKAADVSPFANSSSARAVRRIDFILTSKIATEQAEIEIAGIRTQAGFDHTRVHILPNDSPGGTSSARKSQAELIRASLADKPQAIVLDPDDPADKALAAAVHEARAAKVPVVVVARPIAGEAPGKAAGAAPMILVRPHTFADSARRLVEVAIRNLNAAQVDPGRGAIIVVTDSGDRLIPDRAAAIRKALTDAKIGVVEELVVPREMQAGAAVLTPRLQSKSGPVMIFFLDYSGAMIAREGASHAAEDRPLVVAGYTADDARTRMVMAGDYAAVAEYDPIRLPRKAVSVAVAAVQGRESKDVEEVAIDVVSSPPGSGLTRVRAERTARENAAEKKPPQ